MRSVLRVEALGHGPRPSVVRFDAGVGRLESRPTRWRAPRIPIRFPTASASIFHARRGRRLRRRTAAKIGASWEGLGQEAVFQHLDVRPRHGYFWATHTAAELDLLVTGGRHLYGFEIKRTTSPKIAPSMRSALEDFQLARLDVIHAASETQPLGRSI